MTMRRAGIGQPVDKTGTRFNPQTDFDFFDELNRVLTAVPAAIIGPSDASETQYALRRTLAGALEHWNGAAWTVVQGGGASGPTYAPAFTQVVNVTNPTSAPLGVPVQVVIRTAQARADGADIRVRRLDPDGGILTPRVPHAVALIKAAPGGALDYTLRFADTLGPNETARYEVTYGDPNSTWATFTQAELLNLAAPATRIGTMSVLAGGAYAPDLAAFGTAGDLLVGARDDISTSFPFPAPVRFNGLEYTAAFHNSNGGLSFSTGDAPRPSTGPLSFGWSAADLYESWRRTVTLPDGFAYHILTGTSGYSANMKLTLRYQTSGIWTLTMFHNASGAPSTVRLDVNGATVNIAAAAPIVETNPESWISIRVLDGYFTASVDEAGEAAYSGDPASGSGTVPLSAAGIQVVARKGVTGPSVQAALEALAQNAGTGTGTGSGGTGSDPALAGRVTALEGINAAGRLNTLESLDGGARLTALEKALPRTYAPGNPVPLQAITPPLITPTAPSSLVVGGNGGFLRVTPKAALAITGLTLEGLTDTPISFGLYRAGQQAPLARASNLAVTGGRASFTFPELTLAASTDYLVGFTYNGGANNPTAYYTQAVTHPSLTVSGSWYYASNSDQYPSGVSNNPYYVHVSLVPSSGGTPLGVTGRLGLDNLTADVATDAEVAALAAVVDAVDAQLEALEDRVDALPSRADILALGARLSALESNPGAGGAGGAVVTVTTDAEGYVQLDVQTLTRDAITLTTATLAPGEQVAATLPLGRGFLARRVTTSAPARVRAYRTPQARDADAARGAGTAPTGDHGLIFEQATSAAQLSVPLGMHGWTETAPPTPHVPVLIQNAGTQAAAITVTVQRLLTEI